MKLIFEEFDNLTKYISIIGSRNANIVFKDEVLHSASNGWEFTMTKNYEEACNIARDGYQEGLDQMKAINNKSRHMGTANRSMPTLGPVGFAPHVPNAIVGIPMSMISKTEIAQKAKVISILYYMGGSAGVDISEFVKAGKNIMNVIYSLELQGYRVALHVMTSFCAGDEYAINCVQIKNWRQPSNPLKIAYPLIHPSYFRRNGFRWLETQPKLTSRSFISGYGRPLEYIVGKPTVPDERRTWLKKQNILKDGWFYTERTEAWDNEAEELVKKMGIVG